MWIRASGKISEHVVQVTTPVSSHLLFIGEDAAALVDTGIAALAPTLVEQVNQYVGGTPLRYVFLTHAHFDHLGGLPHLRQSFGELEVVASPICRELLADAAYLERLFEQNVQVGEAIAEAAQIEKKSWGGSFDVERVIGDGDSISLGGDIEVKAIASPGHSEDSVSYYLRADGTVAVGDAIGSFHGRRKYSASFSHSFAKYIATLDRLSTLDIRAIGFGHSGALTGDLAKGYCVAARETAEQMANTIKEQLTQGKVKEEVTETLCMELLEQGLFPDGPFAVSMRENVAGMVSAVTTT